MSGNRETVAGNLVRSAMNKLKFVLDLFQLIQNIYYTEQIVIKVIAIISNNHYIFRLCRRCYGRQIS